MDSSLLSTTPITSSREQAIDSYRALLKRKKDTKRKNNMMQTKIANYVRKNKIDLGNNIANCSNLSSEEEAVMYEDLLNKLRTINETEVNETNEMNEELAMIKMSKAKIERKISAVEEQFKEAKSKIIKQAKDSKTGKTISQNFILATGKVEKEKKLEMRRLLLRYLREKNRLEQVESEHREDYQFSTSDPNLSSQLAMENALCFAELEKVSDKDVKTKYRISESIVMMSHIHMKLHFLNMGANMLEAQKSILKATEDERKAELKKAKCDAEKLYKERANLENRALLVANLKLLRDYKQTSDQLEINIQNNKKLKKILGHWWEGLD